MICLVGFVIGLTAGLRGHLVLLDMICTYKRPCALLLAAIRERTFMIIYPRRRQKINSVDVERVILFSPYDSQARSGEFSCLRWALPSVLAFVVLLLCLCTYY